MSSEIRQKIKEDIEKQKNFYVKAPPTNDDSSQMSAFQGRNSQISNNRQT